MPVSPAAPMTFNRAIHGLRGFSVIAVVVYHYFPELAPGGFVGVDIFFVISGYLITRWLLQRSDLEASRLLAAFWKGRVLRLAPAFFIMFVAVYTLATIFFLPSELRFLGKHGTAGLLGAANFTLWSESGYFDEESSRKPFLHLWSLGVEEQFYLFWPIALLLVFALTTALTSRRRPSFLIILTSVLALVSFLLGATFTFTFPAASFFLLPARAWELFAGALVAIFFGYGLVPSAPRIHVAATKVASLAILGFAVFQLNSDVPFPGVIALVPVVGATLWIVSAELSESTGRSKFSPPLLFFGTVSYSFYLWHWPLLSIGVLLLGEQLDTVAKICILAVSLIVATASTYLVEIPIRRSGWSRKKSFTILSAWAALIAFSLAFYLSEGFPSRLPAQASSASEQLEGWQYRENKTCVERFDFAASEDYPWWFCYLEEDRPPTVALIGSSVMNQMVPGLIAREELNSHNFLSIGTCGALMDPLLFIDFQTANPCTSERRVEQNEYFETMLSDVGPEFVFLGANPNSAAFIGPALERLRVYDRLGSQLILIKYWKIPPFGPQECLSRPVSLVSGGDCSMGLEHWAASENHWRLLEARIIQEFPHVKIFDPNVAFCDKSRCDYLDEGVPIMRDSVHLSVYGSEKVGEAFVKWADSNLPSIIKPSTAPFKIESVDR